MEAYVQKKPAEELKPPVTSVGVIGWVRSNLFKGWFNSLLTIITIYCLWLLVYYTCQYKIYRFRILPV
jgi:general L-amino acid transport system permease protein